MGGLFATWPSNFAVSASLVLAQGNLIPEVMVKS